MAKTYSMKKFSMTRLSIIAFAVLSIIAVSCNEDNNDGNPPAQSITDIVVGDPNFSILEAAVVKAGLADALATTNPLTVFAPDNAAFNASGITEATIASLPVSAVDSILKYHVLGAFVTSTSVPVSDAVTPLLGIKLICFKQC